MKFFDRVVPQKLCSSIKEWFFFFDYLLNNFGRRWERFSQIEIETNSLCNRKCAICPRSTMGKEEGDMDMEIIRNILTQLKHMKFRGRIAPVFYNEPTLDSRLEKIISEMRGMLPRATIFLYTNGSLATADLFETLSAAGVDVFVVSQYEKNVPRDGARILSLMRELSPRTRKKVRYRVLHDVDILSNRGGLVTVTHHQKKKRCFRASTNCVIDFKGNVLLCCDDFTSHYILGNIHKESLEMIWNSKQAREIRKKLRKGIFENEMCRNCVGQ